MEINTRDLIRYIRDEQFKFRTEELFINTINNFCIAQKTKENQEKWDDFMRDDRKKGDE